MRNPKRKKTYEEGQKIGKSALHIKKYKYKIKNVQLFELTAYAIIEREKNRRKERQRKKKLCHIKIRNQDAAEHVVNGHAKHAKTTEKVQQIKILVCDHKREKDESISANNDQPNDEYGNENTFAHTQNTLIDDGKAFHVMRKQQ